MADKQDTLGPIFASTTAEAKHKGSAISDEDMVRLIALADSLLVKCKQMEHDVYSSEIIDHDETIPQVYALRDAVHMLSGIVSNMDEVRLATEVSAALSNT
jgi:hypothetical protein